MPATAKTASEMQQPNGQTRHEPLFDVKIIGWVLPGVLSDLPIAHLRISRADSTILPIATQTVGYRLNDVLVCLEDLTMGTASRSDLIAAATFAVLSLDEQHDGKGPPRGSRRVRLAAD